MVYWPVLSAQELQARQEQLEIRIGKGNEDVTPHIYEVRLVAE